MSLTTSNCLFLLCAVFSEKKNKNKTTTTAQLFKKLCFRLCASTTREIRIGSLGQSRVIFVAKPSTLWLNNSGNPLPTTSTRPIWHLQLLPPQYQLFPHLFDTCLEAVRWSPLLQCQLSTSAMCCSQSSYHSHIFLFKECISIGMAGAAWFPQSIIHEIWHANEVTTPTIQSATFVCKN